VFQVGLALLRFCHDDLVSFLVLVLLSRERDFKELLKLPCCQVKLPFEELLHSLRNFPEEATDPDKLLPLAFSFKVGNCFLKQMRHSYYLLY
jgi:hypothetical protein